MTYKSKYNNKGKKQVILLMITNGKKQHYLAVTDISAMLKRISSNHKEDFYCLNCFNSYTSKNKLKEHEEICNNHDSYQIKMPKQVEQVLKYNLGEKSLKAAFAIYLDLECLLKKEQFSDNNNNNNNNNNIIILKNHTHRKKLSMNLLVGQCLQDVHLIKKKINLIIIEEKIVLKNYVKN